MCVGLSLINFYKSITIYNVVLVSAVQQQSESVSYISTVFEILFLYSSLQTTEFPVLYSRSLLVIYVIYSSVYMLIPISQFTPPSLSSFNSKFVFYVCVSISFFL